MGNRAMVVFTNEDHSEISPAVYLHWNGGPESIYAFLDECRRRKVGGDPGYAAARLAHVVADFFDQEEAGSTSLGVLNGPAAITTEAMAPLACVADDNGVYVVALGKKWTVRRFIGAFEMTRKAVNTERRMAYEHDTQGKAFADVFKRLRPKVSDHG